MPKARSRKNSVAEAGPLLISDDVREKSRSLLEGALRGPDQDHGTDALARSIEEEIFHEHPQAPAYRQGIRSHLGSLRDENNPLRSQLLSSVLTAKDFASMTGEALAANRAREHAALRDQELRSHIRKPMEENIQSLKQDGRMREKWGVGGSAAAVDD